MDSFEDWLRTNSGTLPSTLDKWSSKLVELGASWDTFSRETDATIDDLVEGGIPRLSARDICRAVSDILKQRKVPLSIFWDIENVPIPSGVSGSQVASRLKAVLAPHGDLKQFRGYCHIALGHIPELKRSELQLSGCTLVDSPHHGRKEVADKMIIVDAMEFAFTHPDGATLCFITGDVDYAYLLSKLQKTQWTTIVIAKGNASTMLDANCDVKMRWETDVLQLPMSQIVSNTLQSNAKQEQQESSASLATESDARDDAALLRKIVIEGAESPSDIRKSMVGIRLKQIDPKRFADRSAIKAFLAHAIDTGVVIETGEGAFKELHVPSESSRTACSSKLSLSGGPPIDLQEMPPKALEMAKTRPLIMFVKKLYVPKGSNLFGEAFIQNSEDYLILMFQTLADAQRKAETMPYLFFHGKLVDWRKCSFKKIQSQSQSITCNLVTPFPCATCARLMPETDTFLVPNESNLLCLSCFEDTEFWTAAEVDNAQERVLSLLSMMADCDDVYVPRNILRKTLMERWPGKCASRGQASHWIDLAVEAGNVIEAKRGKVKTLFLPEYKSFAEMPHPPDDFNTSEEEAFVVDLLWENGGIMDRVTVNNALKESFGQRMSTPMARTKVFLDARSNKNFFLAKGERGQCVGLSYDDAKDALNFTLTDKVTRETEEVTNLKLGSDASGGNAEASLSSLSQEILDCDEVQSASTNSSSATDGLERLVPNSV